jgi:hypothetical protein
MANKKYIPKTPTKVRPGQKKLFRKAPAAEVELRIEWLALQLKEQQAEIETCKDIIKTQKELLTDYHRTLRELAKKIMQRENEQMAIAYNLPLLSEERAFHQGCANQCMGIADWVNESITALGLVEKEGE